MAPHLLMMLCRTICCHTWQVKTKAEKRVFVEIESTIRAIQYFGKESHLIHLRDTLPFSEEHAPGLFKGNFQLRESHWGGAFCG